MRIAQVVGTVVSTNKLSGLGGYKLLVVRFKDGSESVATDKVGAGIGNGVLVVEGDSARVATGDMNTPTDATIVGILDESEG